MKGNAFEDPIIINLNTKTDEITIIDGQHRFLAIQGYLSRYPNAQVSLHATQYTDLTLTQMNEVYKIHSDQRKQNIADRLKMERDENKVIDLLLGPSNFPVPISVSSRTDAWNLPRLLRAYFNRYYPPERMTRTSIDSFMYAVKLLDMNDFNRLAEFCDMHKKIFGKPSSSNVMCGSGSTGVLVKIYFYNVDKIGIETSVLEARFKNLIGESTFIQEGKSMDSLVMRRLYDFAIAKMNIKDRNKTIQPIPMGKM